MTLPFDYLAPTGVPVSPEAYTYDVVSALSDASFDARDGDERQALVEAASFMLRCAALGVAVMADNHGHISPRPFPKEVR